MQLPRTILCFLFSWTSSISLKRIIDSCEKDKPILELIFWLIFLVICIYQGEVSLQPNTLSGRTFSFTFSSNNSVQAIRLKCFVIETLSFSPLWGPYMFPYLRTNWLISLFNFQNFLPCIHKIKGTRLLRKKNKYVWERAIDHP